LEEKEAEIIHKLYSDHFITNQEKEKSETDSPDKMKQSEILLHLADFRKLKEQSSEMRKNLAEKQ
jgi:hypothetical protein